MVSCVDIMTVVRKAGLCELIFGKDVMLVMDRIQGVIFFVKLESISGIVVISISSSHLLISAYP